MEEKEILLTPNQCLNATILFLESIWEIRNERFSPHAGDEFGVTLSSLSWSYGEWKGTFEYVFAKTLKKTTLITKSELFTVIIEICARYHYEWGNEILEIVYFLYAMRWDKQNNYQKERMLWEAAICKALEGYGNQRFGVVKK